MTISAKRQASVDELLSGIGRLARLINSRRTFALAADAAAVRWSAQEMHVLGQLAVDGAATSGELARRARMDAGAVSRQLATLAEGDLVTRRSGPGNTVIVEITPAGQAVVDDLDAVRRTQLVRALHRWSDAELQAFGGFLQRFVDDTSATPYQATDRIGGTHAQV